jgi:5-methylcytosine-specific restriction endonuclease McrA
MRHLAVPFVDAEAAYLRISGVRLPIERRARLLDARNRVFDAYAAYVASATDVTQLAVADTSPATADDLITNYDHRTAGCASLRSVVLGGNTGGKCVFCDRATATTLDHYLPKSDYPEFSVYPPNLLPCCADCNLRKLATYRDGAAVFLHCYFDVIPDVQFVFADVTVRPEGVVFAYRVEPPNELGHLADRIGEHFDRLALAVTYGLEAVHETAERTYELRRIYEATDGDALEISAYLAREADSVSVAKGPNHWRAVALYSLSESHDFCDGGFML